MPLILILKNGVNFIIQGEKVDPAEWKGKKLNPACAVTGCRLLNRGSRWPRSKRLWAHETCHAHTRIGIDRSLARMHWFREIATSLEHCRERN